MTGAVRLFVMLPAIFFFLVLTDIYRLFELMKRKMPKIISTNPNIISNAWRGMYFVEKLPAQIRE